MRERTEGIITGDGEWSMRTCRKIEWRGHEAEDEDDKRKKSSPAAVGIERGGIVNGSDAKEAHAEK